MKTCRKGLHQRQEGAVTCVECRKISAKKRHLANPEILRSRDRGRYSANPAKKLAINAKWREDNTEKVKSGKVRWAKENPDKIKRVNANSYLKRKDHVKEVNKKWREANPEKAKEITRSWNAANAERVRRVAALWLANNPEKAAATFAKRRATKLKATPAWANSAKIEEFYYTAKMLGMHTGEVWEVDHIIPLQSSEVCGLHWEGNLQILTRTENRSKGNKLLHTNEQS